MSEQTIDMPGVTDERLASHLAVLEAINRTGRLVASFDLDAEGRTIGARADSYRSYRCSGCHADGHSIERCNGEGQPPKPTYQERRVAERVRKLVKRANYDLDEARAEIQRRIEARRRK